MRTLCWIAVVLTLACSALADDPDVDAGIRFVPTDYGFGPLEVVGWERTFRIVVTQDGAEGAPPGSVVLSGDGVVERTLDLRVGDRAGEWQTDELRADRPGSSTHPLVVRAPHGTVLKASHGGRSAKVTVWALFRIGKVTIDDLPRQVRAMDLRSKMDEARRLYEARREAYAKQEEALREAMSRASALTGQQAVKKRQLEDAKQEQDDEAKRRYHEALGRMVANGERMLDELRSDLERLRADPQSSPEVIEKTKAGIARVAAELNRKRERWETLGREIREAEQGESREERVVRLSRELAELERALRHVASDLEFRRGAEDDARTGLTEAEKAHAEAIAAWRQHTDPTRFRLTRIETDAYEATHSLPVGHLKQLDQIVHALEDHLRGLVGQRLRWGSEQNKANEHTNAMSTALGKAAFDSAFAQYGVEAGDFIADVVKSWREGGPYAAGFTVIRQAVENIAFPPTYYDPAYSVDKPVDFTGLSWDSAKSSIGELMSKVCGGQASEAIVSRYLQQRAAQDLETMWKEVVRGSWFDVRMAEVDPDFYRRFTDAVAEELAEQRMSLVTAERKYKTAIGGRGVRPILKSASRSFAAGLLRSVGKEVAKRAIAEFFEGVAFSKYVESQADLRFASRMFMRASNAYWATYDIHQALEGVRDQLVRRYDASTSLLASRNEWFTPERRYEVRISDAKGDPFSSSDREMEVFLGGVPLERSGRTLVFLLPEARIPDLRRDTRGELPLRIRILR